MEREAWWTGGKDMIKAHALRLVSSDEVTAMILLN